MVVGRPGRGACLKPFGNMECFATRYIDWLKNPLRLIFKYCLSVFPINRPSVSWAWICENRIKESVAAHRGRRISKPPSRNSLPYNHSMSNNPEPEAKQAVNYIFIDFENVGKVDLSPLELTNS
jgi:hypothetical protein